MVQYRGPASSSGLALHRQEYTIEKQNHTTFVNAAAVDPTYKLVNNPILFLI